MGWGDQKGGLRYTVSRGYTEQWQSMGKAADANGPATRAINQIVEEYVGSHLDVRRRDELTSPFELCRYVAQALMHILFHVFKIASRPKEPSKHRLEQELRYYHLYVSSPIGLPGS